MCIGRRRLADRNQNRYIIGMVFVCSACIFIKDEIIDLKSHESLPS